MLLLWEIAMVHQKAYVEKMRNQGYNVILEIEVEGAKQIMKKCR